MKYLGKFEGYKVHEGCGLWLVLYGCRRDVVGPKS